jgi:hypothetical protein
MEPEVRHLIVCDQVRIDPQNYHRIDILGLITRLRSTKKPPFPMVRPQLSVFVVLRAGEAAGQTGDLSVRIVQDSTDRLIFHTRPRRIRFVQNPEDTSGVEFCIQNCSFPAAGLYWVECLFSGTVLGRQRLYARR